MKDPATMTAEECAAEAARVAMAGRKPSVKEIVFE